MLPIKQKNSFKFSQGHNSRQTSQKSVSSGLYEKIYIKKKKVGGGD
jgi:hypothetical protein